MSKLDIPHSYQEASDYLGEKSGRPLCNNTRLIRRYVGDRFGSGIAVRLHATDVVTFHDDGRLTLWTGGWNTVTTRDRMNRALHFSAWYVGTERGTLYLYRRSDSDVRYAWPGSDNRNAVILRPDGRTNAPRAPKRPYRARPHRPDCRCIVHGGSWSARFHGRDLSAPIGPDTVSESGDGDTSCFERPDGVPALSWAEYNRKFNDLIMRGGK